jgi:hypothetical protein
MKIHLRWLQAAVAAMTCAWATHTQAVVVDNFNTGGFDITSDSGWIEVPGGTALIARLASVSDNSLNGNPIANFQLNSISYPGELFGSVDAGEDGSFSTQYSGGNVDLTAGGESIFRMNFLTNTAATSVSLTLESNAGADTFTDTLVKSVAFGPLDFALTSFSTAGVDLTAVDLIRFEVVSLTGGAGGNYFRIESFQTVAAIPEPTTVALLACGSLLLLRRQR